MAKHARPDPAALGRVAAPALPSGPIAQAPVAGVLILAAIALGGAVGLLVSDNHPSAASLPRSSPVAAQPTSMPIARDEASLRSVPPDEVIAARVLVTPPTEVDERGWRDVLGRLDATRSEAFARGEVTLLAAVYVEGSPPHERDAAALTELAGSSIHAVGLRLVIDEIDVVRAGGDEVVLRVTDRMPGYRLVTADGSVAEIRPARGPATWLVTLRGGGPAWRIAAITVA